MKMKTFEADTMQEALAKVKQDLGPDAVIVKNRKVTRRRDGRFVDAFEVTAALEEVASVASPVNKAVPVGPAMPQSTPSLAEQALNAYDRRAPRKAEGWSQGLRRVTESGHPVDGQGPMRPVAGISVEPAKTNPAEATAKFMDLLRSEFKEVRERVEMPTRELRLLKRRSEAYLIISNALFLISVVLVSLPQPRRH